MTKILKIIQSAFVPQYQSLKSRLQKSVIWQRFFKNLSINVIGSIVLMIVAVGRTAVLTKSLTIDDYGRVMIVINLFTFLGSFLGLRVRDVLYRFYPQFMHEKDYEALRALILLCFLINLGIGLVLGGGIYALSPWIAVKFYHNVALIPLFRIYAWAAVFTLTFQEICETILRLHDSFVYVVIPQVFGGIVTLGLISVFLLSRQTYHLESIVLAFVAGSLTCVFFPLLRAIQLITPIFSCESNFWSFAALRTYRDPLLSTLFQTNLVGYLNVVGDSGGLFLLGIFASPKEVALYDLARQLVTPFSILQNNIQIAITPEIVSLWARKQISQLYKMVKRFIAVTLGLGMLIVLGVVILVRPAISIISKPDYLEALPVFYILVVTTYFTFVSLTFYAVTLCMDRLKHRNSIVAIGLIYIFIAVATNASAIKLAWARLVGALTIRIFNDMTVYRRLRKIAEEELTV